jgi:pyruvate,water dikinase
VEANQATWQLSRRITESETLVDAFRSPTSREVLSKLESSREGRVFLEEFEAFRREYAFKGAEDREISVPRWGDDRELLVEILKTFAQVGEEAVPATMEERSVARREEATRELLESLRGQRWGWIKQRIGVFLLKHAQSYSLFRENQRYDADRVFYAERKVFVEIGRRLAQTDVLPEADDVWFLSKEEVLDALRGKMGAADAKSLIVPRKAEHRRYSQTTPLMFLQGDREFEAEAPDETRIDDAETFRGVAASPGKATGRARVVHSIRELSRIESGDILVTNSTDPGWTPAFLLIQGLVLETGGILAHGTVLAREYGLPAVTSVSDATARIADGDEITIDGSRGTVHVVGSASPVS